MADKTLKDLLAVVTPAKPSGDIKGTSFVNDFRSIVQEVTKGLKELKDLQDMLSPAAKIDAPKLPSPTLAEATVGKTTLISTVKKEGAKMDFKKFLVTFLTNLKEQGYGSSQLSEVVLSLPITINEALNYINNPLDFIAYLLQISQTIKEAKK